MKWLLAVLAAAVLAGVGTGVWMRREAKVARLRLEERLERLAADHARDRAAWEGELAAARNQAPVVVRVPADSPATTRGPTPAEVIETLRTLRVGSGPQRIRGQREVVYHLGVLHRHGDAAVPAIREFLLRFEDVDYLAAPPAEADEDGETEEAGPAEAAGAAGPESRRRAGTSREEARRDLAAMGRGSSRSGRGLRFDYELPPTLRLGLIDALGQIATPDAVAILLEVLRTTGRGLEVAYLTRTLENLAPGQYRDEAVRAARDLLSHPPETAGNTRLDSRQKSYLYRVLEFYGDPSFADAARGVLVDASGRLDPQALSYLQRVLGEQALPTLYQAWVDPRVTNLLDRARLMTGALPQVGTDGYANSMFANVVTNTGLPREMRELTLREIVRPQSPGEGADPAAESARWQGRLEVLQQIRATAGEPELAKALDRAMRLVEGRLAGGAEEGGRGRRQDQPRRAPSNRR